MYTFEYTQEQLEEEERFALSFIGKTICVVSSIREIAIRTKPAFVLWVKRRQNPSPFGGYYRFTFTLQLFDNTIVNTIYNCSQLRESVTVIS